MIKQTFITAYVMGHNSGWQYGMIDGIGAWAETLDKMEKQGVIKKETAHLFVKDSARYLIEKGTSDLQEAPQFYMREIDSFLATYPLCKRREIKELFHSLSQVWSRNKSAAIPKATYESFGKSCSEINK